MHKRKRKFVWPVLLVAAVFFLAFKFGPGFLKKPAEKANTFRPAAALASSSKPDETVSINPDRLRSPCAILVCLDDHAVLMQKNSNQKIYPASLTKMMTAVVAIESLPDLQKQVELPASIFRPLYREDASMAGFLPGEKVRAVDLLYGALLPSGAECCMGLADSISGSEEKFVQKMNQKAKELGMDRTHFTNPTGLQDPDHYTTVKDLSVLLSYALQNKLFRQIFTSPRHSTSSTNKHPHGITFQSTLFRHLKSPAIPGGVILGGKTGYTDQAGLCLASLSQKGGKEYILVTAGAKGDHKSEQYDIDDARKVYGEIK